MKYYDDINLDKDKVVETKQQKHKLKEYDINNELGMNQNKKEQPMSENESHESTINNSTMNYDFNELYKNTMNDNSDSDENNKVSGIIWAIAFTVVSIAIIALIIFIVSQKGYVNPQDIKSNFAISKDVTSSSNSSDVTFTSINSSETYTLSSDDIVSFVSSTKNQDNNIYIEFSISNVTTNEYYCDEMVSGDGTFAWSPSDYISADNKEYTIGITQTAFKSPDLTEPIATNYSEIKIIMESE